MNDDMKCYVEEATGAFHCFHCNAHGEVSGGGFSQFKTALLNRIRQMGQTRNATQPAYWEGRGFTLEEIEEFGLGFYEPMGRYVVPSGDTLAFRAADTDDDKIKYLRVPHDPVTYTVCGASNATRVFVVEGEVNAYSIATVLEDDERVVGLPGAGNIKLDMLSQYIPSGARVIGIFDNDDAGKTGAKKLRQLAGTKTVLWDADANFDLMHQARDNLRQRLTEAIVSGQEDTPEQPKPKAISGAEFIKMPQPQYKWIIQDLWMAQSLGFVAGIPKSMKSMFTLHLAAHVTNGGKFLGKDILQPGPVLLVQEEDPDHIIRERLQGIAELDISRLFLWTPGLRGDHLRIDTEDGADALDETIRELQPVLVILDPLANMHALENENDAAAMNRMLERLRHIRDIRRCSIMVVHHRRKENENDRATMGQRMRGSSVIHAKSENALYITRVEGSTLLKIHVENKMAPGRTLDVVYRNGDFHTEGEYGAGTV